MLLRLLPLALALITNVAAAEFEALPCESVQWSEWGACQPHRGRACGGGWRPRQRDFASLLLTLDDARVAPRPEECPSFEWGACEIPCDGLPPFAPIQPAYGYREHVRERQPHPNANPHASVVHSIRPSAVLLDYALADIRARKGGRRYGGDVKHEEKEYYCAEYTIDWVHSQCGGSSNGNDTIIDLQQEVPFYKGDAVCIECQPEVQNKNKQCGGDVVDGGVKGNWKMANSKWCFGTWSVTNRTEACKCGRDKVGKQPFLFL